MNTSELLQEAEREVASCEKDLAEKENGLENARQIKAGTEQEKQKAQRAHDKANEKVLSPKAETAWRSTKQDLDYATARDNAAEQLVRDMSEQVDKARSSLRWAREILNEVKRDAVIEFELVPLAREVVELEELAKKKLAEANKAFFRQYVPLRGSISAEQANQLWPPVIRMDPVTGRGIQEQAGPRPGGPYRHMNDLVDLVRSGYFRAPSGSDDQLDAVDDPAASGSDDQVPADEVPADDDAPKAAE